MTDSSVKKKLSASALARGGTAILVLLSSIMFMTGWVVQNPSLVSLRSSWPPIGPITSICAFLCGIISLLGVRSHNSEMRRTWRDFAGVVLAGVLALIAVVTMVRYFTGQTSFDVILTQDFIQSMGLTISMGMAPITAVCFFLTSVWFMADFIRGGFSVFKFSISLSILIIVGLILVAYLYGASTVYELPLLVQMSFLTAGVFAVLQGGLVTTVWPEGLEIQSPGRFWNDRNTVNERPLFITLAVVFVGFLIAGVVASRSLNLLINTISRVSETQTRVSQLDEVLEGLLNAESGQRGYVLTGEEGYLGPYFAGYNQHQKALRAIRSWAVQEPQYREALQEIIEESQVKFTELAQTIELYRTRGAAAAVKLIRTDVGKATMDRIRNRVAFIKTDQVDYLTAQRKVHQVQARATITALTTGSVLAALILLASLNFYIKNSLRRSQIEDEVRDLNQSLEFKLREIEVVNRELESFSYSVSHDLRAPLRAMSGFSNILLEDHLQSLNEDAQKYLARIIAAADKMSHLINGILELSRISRHEVNRERVALSELVAQFIEELRGQDPQRSVKVTIAPHLTASGDLMLLSAFLQNLILNAWKFTSKKDHAEIEFGSFEETNRRVFFVRDNGAGFDMAFAEKLFGTFQRLHADSEFKGTGVGLATARRIVHLHGGEIWAEAKVNEGACFYFTLEPEKETQR